jgi:hypothetical protein
MYEPFNQFEHLDDSAEGKLAQVMPEEQEDYANRERLEKFPCWGQQVGERAQDIF